ncbi:RuvC-like resolvase [Gordonia phage Pupper]|uniref:RuvC-like resolvase n=1 Tax=Gordonia phage Pupper TaxID=2571249 RepID=A0A4Y6ETM2_9CAUD|nr:RuvC-like Holliday junction resolvase [Gordonia phage Pupper]QDF18664.1 RuvC-like resolvase [Gordonia phage Pupper]QDF18896.1 RuvC-like resolvase [Gordonia phage SCentae]
MTYRYSVGIDSSLTSSGVVVIDLDTRGVDIRRVKSSGKKDDTWEMRHDRQVDLEERIGQFFYPGTIVGIEGPSYGNTQGSVHDRAGLWWAVYREAIRRGADVRVVPIASRIRYATGKGAGNKDAVLAATIKRYPELDITGNDEADAFLIASLTARSVGQIYEETPLAAIYTKALEKVGPLHVAPELTPIS